VKPLFACIYIPDFPVEAIVRTEPLLRKQAVAVLEGKPPLVRVVALNEKARLLGMRVGMTKLQATVFTQKRSSAVLHQRSPEHEKSAHSLLLDVSHAFTPRVEDSASDTLLLDLAGLERLYGAPVKMARALATRERSTGLMANIALAANPDAAMHAARGFSGVTVIPAGKEARRLGVLPLRILLDTLDASLGKTSTAGEREREKRLEQMLDTLESWGARDFHALALLPSQALASRLGEAGTHLQRLARGAGMRTLALCEPPPHFEEAMELESPVETLEPLTFILNRLLEQLCARLEVRALAALELHLRLQLEPRVTDEETITVQELCNSSHSVRQKTLERTLRLPVPMRDTKVFLKLLQLELAAHPPGAPITKVWILAKPAAPRSAQRGLFLSIFPEAEKLEITLARIAGIVGKQRVGMVHLRDSYRQDSFEMARFVAGPEGSNPTKYLPVPETEKAPPLALRVFRPAPQLRIRLSEGRPVHLTVMAKNPDRAVLQGQICWSAGPWRSSGDWWMKNEEESNTQKSRCPFDREEWDVALANGNGMEVGLYRIYRDLASGHWFADASYD